MQLYTQLENYVSKAHTFSEKFNIFASLNPKHKLYLLSVMYYSVVGKHLDVQLGS